MASIDLPTIINTTEKAFLDEKWDQISKHELLVKEVDKA